MVPRVGCAPLWRIAVKASSSIHCGGSDPVARCHRACTVGKYPVEMLSSANEHSTASTTASADTIRRHHRPPRHASTMTAAANPVTTTHTTVLTDAAFSDQPW